MQAITKTRGDELCCSCMMHMLDEALRCNKCVKLCHLSCSGLQESQLIRYLMTRSQYTCQACLIEDEKYTECQDKLKLMLSEENKIISCYIDLANYVAD